ncbi:MAG: class II aldolase/adducin family protein [Bdellovibrionales bacterium]
MSYQRDYTDEEVEKIKLDIVAVCRVLNQKNMLAAADGNVSFRLSDDRILITPTAINKAFMSPEEIATINIRGDILSGHPSGERLMHLEVFKRCPQARCIVHAHPPTAIAWSLARPHLTELPFECLPEVILAVGRMPIIPYARPGTVEMGTHLSHVLPKYRVMILARHGGLSWGESLSEAYNGMERLEHSALILKNATELASMNTISHLPALPEAEIRALQKMRDQSSGRTL